MLQQVVLSGIRSGDGGCCCCCCGGDCDPCRGGFLFLRYTHGGGGDHLGHSRTSSWKDGAALGPESAAPGNDGGDLQGDGRRRAAGASTSEQDNALSQMWKNHFGP